MAHQSLVNTFDLAGCKIEVHNFGYASFYYPTFNSNAEYPVTSKGFRQLSHYVRTVKYFGNMVQSVINSK